MSNATQPNAVAGSAPPWFVVALGEIGEREVAGTKDNARIIEYFSATTIPRNDLRDEVAWCSAFANWSMFKAAHIGTRKANARSWLEWGQACEPRLGAVTVFWRGSPDDATGHVAFYVGEDAQSIYVLGGNQSNAVCLAAYPRARLLGYRWPTIAERKV